MKKLKILIILSFVLTMFSCEKKDIQVTDNAITPTKSSYQNVTNNKQFVRDLIITDKTGENSIYFRIYSSSEKHIDSFINNHNLSIEASTEVVV